jgi:DNA invertase Pin-like site-specific DNA recombinase
VIHFEDNMARGKFVSYLRVSTQRQGRSGLGLAGQRHAVLQYLDGGRWRLVGEFVEIESGRNNSRPQLQLALAACRIHGATLIVAKLDRLARNAAFLLSLQEAGVEFVCADMPEANRLTIGILACVAEDEARRISDRTRAALAAAKRRGVQLGNPAHLTESARAKGRAVSSVLRVARADRRAQDLRPIINDICAGKDLSLRRIAAELSERGVPTPRGGYAWNASQVQRLLARL